MILKHVLKYFNKTEVQEDRTHPTYLSQTILNRLFGRVLEREGALGVLNNAEHNPLPLREREELLCERSELSNSGEGCKDLPSPVAFATQSPKCRKTRHFDKMLKQVQHDNFSCAEHTEKHLSSNRLSILTTLKHKLDCFAYARNDDLCAEHAVKDFSPFTSHFSQLCTPHPSPLPQGARENASCAEHTVKDLSSNRLSVLTTSKKAAFTLAEVLITLAIIGVVAALTLPSVIKNKENIELQSALKLAYSTLNQALLLYQNDNGIPLKQGDIVVGQLKPILLKYIKNARDCGWGTEGEKACMPSKNYVNDKENYKPIYKTFNGANEIDTSFFDGGQFIMNNSMLVMLENYSFLLISVDINGIDKKPNRLGQDLFMFQITDNGRLLPMGANGTLLPEYHCKDNLKYNMNGAGCTNKALREKDFFKKLPK